MLLFTFLLAIDIKDDTRKRCYFCIMLVNTFKMYSTLFRIMTKTYLPGQWKTLQNIFSPWVIFAWKWKSGPVTSRIRKLSAHCEFHGIERELKSQIELGFFCTRKFARYAFQSPDLKLEELLLYAWMLEYTKLSVIICKKNKNWYLSQFPCLLALQHIYRWFVLKSEICNFEDDSTIYSCGKDLNEIVTNMEYDLCGFIKGEVWENTKIWYVIENVEEPHDLQY